MSIAIFYHQSAILDKKILSNNINERDKAKIDEYHDSRVVQRREVNNHGEKVK